jgi:hypothetical protein
VNLRLSCLICGFFPGRSLTPPPQSGHGGYRDVSPNAPVSSSAAGRGGAYDGYDRRGMVDQPREVSPNGRAPAAYQDVKNFVLCSRFD